MLKPCWLYTCHMWDTRVHTCTCSAHMRLQFGHPLSIPRTFLTAILAWDSNTTMIANSCIHSQLLYWHTHTCYSLLYKHDTAIWSSITDTCAHSQLLYQHRHTCILAPFLPLNQHFHSQHHCLCWLTYVYQPYFCANLIKTSVLQSWQGSRGCVMNSEISRIFPEFFSSFLMIFHLFLALLLHLA